MSNKKRFTVRVTIPKTEIDHSIYLPGLMDSLRYAGLVDREDGFPTVFSYATDHDPSSEVDRWNSFGFGAVWTKYA